MKRRIHLVVGAVCGILCVAGILSYASDLRAEVEEERAAALSRYGGEQVEILVATEDVAVGDLLDSTNSEKRLWLSELVPEGAVSDAEDMATKPATSPIYAGEVVLKHRFDERETVALQVPDGKCAISLPAKAVSTVGGSVGPGSYVDVYAASGTATDLLASQVLVLSTSATSEEEADKKSDVSWVTLAVDPEAVEELITASQKSELYFALPAEEGEHREQKDASDDEASPSKAASEGDLSVRSEGDADSSTADVDASEEGEAPVPERGRYAENPLSDSRDFAGEGGDAFDAGEEKGE